MSARRTVNPSTGAVPKQPRGGSADTSRPGSAGVKRTSSKQSVPGDKTKAPSCPLAAAKQKKELKKHPELIQQPKAYENPAFSIPLKRVQTNPLLAEKDKKKTIRRNIPPGEDTKCLKAILLGLKNKAGITVGELLALVAPSTGDNGELLRSVLTEEMNTFRNLARKIYDTMTRDVSDVLTNQHIQLKEFEQEKTTLYTEKMMRAINEIYTYAPKFDFEAYYANKERYLESIFPVPRTIEATSDEAEMYRRQQAFHRLNWLRTEGDRLSAENTRLQARLNELKKEQQDEMISAEQREAQAEARRAELQAQEADMQNQLNNLTDKVEETMIDTEASIRIATDETNMLAEAKKTGAIKKGTVQRRRKKKTEWVSETAAEIEEIAIEENIIAEGAQSEVEAQSLAGAIKKARSKASKTMLNAQEATTPEKGRGPKKPRSPFHFSPIKTPPSKPPPSKERSPFHFSPLKSPPPRAQKPPSPFHYSPPKAPQRTEVSSPPQLHTTRVRREHVTVQERTPRDLFPPQGGEDVITPSTQLGPQASAAPQRRGIRSTGQERGEAPKMGDLQEQTPQPAPPPPRYVRRGQEHAPRDSWGGFY